MSSDKLAHLQQPLVNLDLDIEHQGSEGRQLMSLEMDADELQRLITSLEAANKVSYTISTLLTCMYNLFVSLCHWHESALMTCIGLLTIHYTLP